MVFVENFGQRPLCPKWHIINFGIKYLVNWHILSWGECLYHVSYTTTITREFKGVTIEELFPFQSETASLEAWKFVPARFRPFRAPLSCLHSCCTRPKYILRNLFYSIFVFFLLYRLRNRPLRSLRLKDILLQYQCKLSRDFKHIK